MDQDLVGGSLGSIGKYDIAFKSGQLVIEVDAAAKAVSAGLVVKVDGKQVLDALAKAIPGTIDDSIMGLIESALGLK